MELRGSWPMNAGIVTLLLTDIEGSHAEDKSAEAAALWRLGKADVLEGNTDSARIRLGGATAPCLA